MPGFRLPGAIGAEQSEHGADLLNPAYFALSLTDPALVIAPRAKNSDVPPALRRVPVKTARIITKGQVQYRYVTGIRGEDDAE